jgi:hypothetical protein
MKFVLKILVIASAVLFVQNSVAQWQRPNTLYGNKQYRISIDSMFEFPTFSGYPTGLKGISNSKALLQFDSTGGKLRVYNPKTLAWITLADSAYAAPKTWQQTMSLGNTSTVAALFSSGTNLTHILDSIYYYKDFSSVTAPDATDYRELWRIRTDIYGTAYPGHGTAGEWNSYIMRNNYNTSGSGRRGEILTMASYNMNASGSVKISGEAGWRRNFESHYEQGQDQFESYEEVQTADGQTIRPFFFVYNKANKNSGFDMSVYAHLFHVWNPTTGQETLNHSEGATSLISNSGFNQFNVTADGATFTHLNTGFVYRMSGDGFSIDLGVDSAATGSNGITAISVKGFSDGTSRRGSIGFNGLTGVSILEWNHFAEKARFEKVAYYGSNIGSSFTTRSLVDKGYVDSAISASSSSLTLAAIGSSPNANGATYTAGTFTLEPASASYGGVLTTGAQTIAGAKTFTGDFKIDATSSTAFTINVSTGNVPGTEWKVNNSSVGQFKVNGTEGYMLLEGSRNFIVYLNGGSFDQAITAKSTGAFGLWNVTSPSSYLHLPAGGSAANKAPLKFTSGTNLATPENGAVEYDGTNLYVTSSSTRYTLAKAIITTAALDFTSISTGNNAMLDVTVTGAALGDAVVVTQIPAEYNLTISAWVDSANTVRVKAHNISGSTIDPSSYTFKIYVLKN